MELKNHEKLQILTAKTLELHKKITDRINQSSFSLCSHCSSHGRYCVVADSSPDERERLIAIGESLKELNRRILSLEVAREQGQRDEAWARVEESREAVRERAEEERENVGVIAEVIEFVGDGFLWGILDEEEEKKKKKKKSVNGIYRFLVGTTRFGIEFLVILATMYTTLEFAKICGKHRNQDVSDSRIKKHIPSFLLNADGDVHLDVLCGRG